MTSPIVFEAQAGLANRLRALVGYRTLAEVNKTLFCVRWIRNPSCNAGFHDLFQAQDWQDVRFIDEAEAAVTQHEHPDRFYRCADWFQDIWAKHASKAIDRSEFCKRSMLHLRSLRPIPRIAKEVHRFAGVHDISSCVGMHIRMTDNLHAYKEWGDRAPDFRPEYVSRLEGFSAAMHRANKEGRRVFVATDNPNVLEQLRADYPAIVTYHKAFDLSGFRHQVETRYGHQTGLVTRTLRRLVRSWYRTTPASWRTTTIEDALIELMLLARCHKIVGTYYSSFSEISALVGGSTLDIILGEQSSAHPFTYEMNALMAP
jgi:hypothetical protein